MSGGSVKSGKWEVIKSGKRDGSTLPTEALSVFKCPLEQTVNYVGSLEFSPVLQGGSRSS